MDVKARCRLALFGVPGFSVQETTRQKGSCPVRLGLAAYFFVDFLWLSIYKNFNNTKNLTAAVNSTKSLKNPAITAVFLQEVHS
jgi:hypothetical protein